MTPSHSQLGVLKRIEDANKASGSTRISISENSVWDEVRQDLGEGVPAIEIAKRIGSMWREMNKSDERFVQTAELET